MVLRSGCRAALLSVSVFVNEVMTIVVATSGIPVLSKDDQFAVDIFSTGNP